MRRIECGDECAAFLSKERWHEEAIQELRRFKFVYQEFKNPGRKAAYEAKLFDLVPNRTELKAQSHGRCAFVGGGHDLRCSKRGSEIDQNHDAVFRANRRADAGLEAHVGHKTTYRVNCLDKGKNPGPKDEICIISRAWWKQKWDAESFNNKAHPCCDATRRSRYNINHLRKRARHHQYYWHTGVTSGDRMMDMLLRSSGGNALVAALSLCRHVNVYGAGLYSKGPEFDKTYLHHYDREARGCLALEAPDTALAFHRPRGFENTYIWRQSRIFHELLLATMHSLGIMSWIQ